MQSKLVTPLFTAFLLLVLIGCGGGSSGGSGSGFQPTNPSGPTVLEGVFIDSPVMGLAYNTATRSGITDSAGTFEYIAGEMVTFSLGGTEFGTASGGAEVTPLDLLGVAEFDDATPAQTQRLNNILVTLQSLDADGNPDNGIDLANLNQALEFEILDFDLDEDEFERSRFAAVLAENGGNLVDTEAARNHFLRTRQITISRELPTLRQTDFDGDGGIDAETVFSYDSIGLLTNVVTTVVGFQARVERSTFEYDANNRMSSAVIREIVEGADSGPGLGAFYPLIISFGYDNQGRISSRSEEFESFERALFSQRYFYDDFGRLAALEKDSPAYSERVPDRWQDGVEVGPIRDILAGTTLSSTPIGEYRERVGFTYSELGIVSETTYSREFVSEFSDPVVKERGVFHYDPVGRLVSADNQILDDELVTEEVATEFIFADSGLLESCSVSVDGQEEYENSDPDSASEAQYDLYEYFGSCNRILRRAKSFNEDGSLATEATNFLFSDGLGPVTGPINSRAEYAYLSGELISISLYGNNDILSSFTEFTDSGSVRTSYDSEGEISLVETTTTQTFEFSFEPPVSPVPL